MKHLPRPAETCGWSCKIFRGTTKKRPASSKCSLTVLRWRHMDFHEFTTRDRSRLAGPGLDRGWIWCSLIQPDPAPIYFWWSTFWVLGSTFWRYDWASCCAQSRIIIVQNPRGNFFDPGWLRMGFPCLGWWQSPIQWHCDTLVLKRCSLGYLSR